MHFTASPLWLVVFSLWLCLIAVLAWAQYDSSLFDEGGEGAEGG